jgi:hypothetical protein
MPQPVCTLRRHPCGLHDRTRLLKRHSIIQIAAKELVERLAFPGNFETDDEHDRYPCEDGDDQNAQQPSHEPSSAWCHLILVRIFRTLFSLLLMSDVTQPEGIALGGDSPIQQPR